MKISTIILTITLIFSGGIQSRTVYAEPNAELNFHHFTGQTMAAIRHQDDALNDSISSEDEYTSESSNDLRNLGNKALMVLGIGSMAVGGLGLIASGSSPGSGSLDQTVALASLVLLTGGVIGTVLGHRGLKSGKIEQKRLTRKYKNLNRSDPIKAQYLRRTELKSNLQLYAMCNKLSGASTVSFGLITGAIIILGPNQAIGELGALALVSAGIWYYCGKQYFTIKEKLQAPWRPLTHSSPLRSQTSEWLLPSANSNSLGLSYGFTF